MKPDDCGNWLRHHCHLHNDFGGWLKSLPPSEYDDFISATEVCLRLVDLPRAKAVSQQMFSGEISKPFAFSAHPGAVKLHGESKLQVASGTADTLQRIDQYRREYQANPIQPTLGAELRRRLAVKP